MATNIPPPNLAEILDGCLAYVDNEEITIDELMQYIPVRIYQLLLHQLDAKGLKRLIKQGAGKVYVRRKRKLKKVIVTEQIVITELPYQVDKKTLIEKIADLVKINDLEGISEIRDLSKKIFA